MSLKTIDGSVALVTGANRGIGRALVEELLERGAAKVYAGARETERLHPLVEQFGERVVPLELDVTDDTQIEAAARVATDVQILLNNAGVVDGTSPAEPGGLEAAKREMEVNYFGILRLVSAFTPALEANGGAIGNVVSIGGLTNFTPYPTYSASKAAAHSMTQAYRALLGPRGIQVSGIYPGPVDTDMARDISFDKATPRSVAARSLEGILAGEEEIFPDAMAEQFGAGWLQSPKASERQLAEMLAGSAAEA